LLASEEKNYMHYGIAFAVGPTKYNNMEQMLINLSESTVCEMYYNRIRRN
jgi:hypothetical protein